MKLYIYYLGLIFILFSCQEKEKRETPFLYKKLPAKEKIKWIFRVENQSVLGMSGDEIKFLKAFYKSRNYSPLWVNDSSLNLKGKNVYKIISQPISLGIPDKRISKKISDKTLIIKEINITNSLATLCVDLKRGILDTLNKKLVPLTHPNLSHFREIINLKSDSLNGLAIKMIAWGPRDTVYQKLALGLFHFAFNNKMSDENLKVPTFKKDSLKSLNLAKKSLVQKQYLLENQNDSIFTLALKQFQLDNGLKDDGVIGQTTAEALNETTLEKCQRASLVLEKLRWKNNIDKRYIEVNIPEYTLRFFADDTLKSVNRIIVGKFDTQTPEFSAELSSIIAYPYWSVPFSITSKEILPDAKRNPYYFAKNNMKVYKKDVELDPLSINWKGIRKNTFPYKVIQQPGPRNSLGIIKFDFHNKYGVYFHDTPQKSLFNTVVRSYSHGCMRCENPIDLARLILLKDENKVIPDSLDSILVRQIHHPIRLKKRIPIYIEYRSVVIDNHNKLIFLRDIYRRDKRLAKMMFA